MQKINSLEEYKNLLQETLYELADLRASVEYDEEFSEGIFSFVGDLESAVKGILTGIEMGTYEFSKGDLGIIEIVERTPSHLLPIKSLLKLIESTHKKGLA